MRTIETVEEVVAELGGTGAVARLTGCLPSAVSNWKAQKRFSAGTFLIIQTELAKRDCTAPASLWGIKEPEQIA